MLEAPDVCRERKSLEENRSMVWRASQEAVGTQSTAMSCKVIIDNLTA